MANGPKLPAFLTIEYEQNPRAGATMLADIERTLGSAKGRFEAAFSEISAISEKMFSTFKRGDFRLNIDMSSLRQASADADYTYQRLVTLRDAAIKLAQATNDTSASTKSYLDALRAQTTEAERARSVSFEQLQTYGRLQDAVDKLADRNKALALSYRETYLEQAKAENYAYRSQQSVNAVAAPGLINRAADGEPMVRSARDSARVFEELFAAQEKAAQSAAEYAKSAMELRQALDPTLAVQQKFDAELARADQLLEAGAISQREYAAAVELARNNLQEGWAAVTRSNAAAEEAARRGTTSNHMMVNSMRAVRTAGIQAGQQMQDMAIQFQMGTKYSTIMAQQIPQLAFALSGLSDSANKTHQRIGRVAEFLSGPWGAAFAIALVAIGPLIDGLFGVEKKSEDAGKATETLAEKLDIARHSFEEVTEASREYNKEQERSRALTLRTAASVATLAAQNIKAAIAIRTQLQAQLEQSMQGDAAINRYNPETGKIERVQESYGTQDIQARLAKNAQDLKVLQETAGNAVFTVAEEIARIDADPVAKVREGFKSMRQEARDSIKDVRALSKRLTEINLQEEAAVDALQKSGRKGRSSRDTGAAARRQADQLENFGDSAAESIQRINERFDEQPRLIDQAAAATRQLDDLIVELGERRPINWEQMVEDAQEAKQTIQEALVRPFEDMQRDSQRRIQIQTLMVAGREDEANALQEIWRLENTLGDLSYERRLEIYEQVKAERLVTEELRARQDLMNSYLSASQSIRQEITAILSGTGKISNLKQAFKNLRGEVLAQQLFGPMFRDLDKWVKEQSGIKSSVNFLEDETKRAGESANKFADKLNEATDKVARAIQPATDPGVSAFDAAFGPIYAPGSAANDNAGDIDGATITVVAPKKTRETVMDLTPERFFQEFSRRFGATLSEELKPLLGDKLAKQVSGVMGQALYGYSTGGTLGGILGGLKGVIDQIGKGDFAKSISGALGDALGGAQTGTMVAGLGDAFGINLSNSGAQIGGAIGKFVPIPGGDIIGAIIGGIFGKIFGGTKRGSALIGNVNGELGITGYYGNSSSRKDASGELAGNIFDSIDRIAEALGANVDASLGAVSIGIRDGNYRVDPTGQGITKTRNGAIDFGDDAEAAVRAATLDLIKDGVLTGLREGTKRLLQNAKDLEKGLEDALDFESVFRRLREYKDPVGAAIDAINKEFERLIDLFDKAGASAEEYAQLEELYGIERAKAIKEATERVTGSLRSLLDELTVGNAALSLRDRKAMAMAAYQPLAQRVAAGDVTAFDDYANAARTLLDIERQISGSQNGYFELLAQVTSLTQGALNNQQALIDAASGSNSPFATNAIAANDNQGVIDAISQTNNLLDAMNQNIITLIQQNGTGTTYYFPRNGTGYW